MSYPASSCRSALKLARTIAAVAFAAAVSNANAVPYELIYTGTFNTTESLGLAGSPLTPFTATTPFTIRAFFDDSTPNLLPPAPIFSGFHAYAPSLATVDIGGVRYTIDAATNVAVSIFDGTQVFNSPRVGVGLIANVVADGAGIVGDFLSASPLFSVNALTPTTFTSYYGVGHSSGVCASGSPPSCPHVNTPWLLHDPSNASWNLLLGNYEEDYPALHEGSRSEFVGALNTAVIVAVPEPETVALMLAGLAVVGARLRRRTERG